MSDWNTKVRETISENWRSGWPSFGPDLIVRFDCLVKNGAETHQFHVDIPCDDIASEKTRIASIAHEKLIGLILANGFIESDIVSFEDAFKHQVGESHESNSS